jgi:drug/metabolite transporter (DMT)-like permease
MFAWDPAGMSKYVFIAGTLLFTLFGQLLLKSRALSLSPSDGEDSKLRYLAAMFTDRFVWAGLGAAVVASICWALAVQQAPLSLAYPFMALSFVFVPLGALMMFGERITTGQWTGSLLIVAGVVVSAVTAGR